MTRIIDTSLAVLKWPVALLAVAMLPALLTSLVVLLQDFVGDAQAMAPFTLGLLGYAAVWALLLRRRVFGSLLSTLEHEFSHALFAWLTLHHVSGLRASWSKGGSIKVHGGDNWLITAAPYFFPTISVGLMLVAFWIPEHWRLYFNLVLGGSLAYHLSSTVLELHPKQPDLRELGLPFVIIFVPSANLLWASIVLAYAQGGLSASGTYLCHLFETSLTQLRGLVAVLS
ncbi:MAG: M50 family metallopeptidase [Myxococcota bacterium]|jgi:hypothetical protein|nr:M50 family metallopeptidase [Myxococcota bacterium]